MQETSKGLRYTEHRWVARRWLCSRVVCLWSVSWLWNPLCPTSNGHKTFTIASSYKNHVKQLCHLQSPCYQPYHHLLVHAHFHLGHWLCPPPSLTNLTPCSPLLLAWLFTFLPSATGDSFFLSTFPAKEIQLQHRTTLLSNHRPSTRLKDGPDFYSFVAVRLSLLEIKKAFLPSPILTDSY